MKKFNFYLEMIQKINDDKFISIKNLIIKRKDFINGILDRLFKQLTEDQKILKEGRGLLDS